MLRLDKTPEDVKTLLQRVTARFPGDPADLDSVAERAQAGELQVFPLEQSVIVGKTYRNGWVWLFGGAGLLSELLAFEPELCQWYRQRGYMEMFLEGRRGWWRALRKLGWFQSDFDGVLRKVIN